MRRYSADLAQPSAEIVEPSARFPHYSAKTGIPSVIYNIQENIARRKASNGPLNKEGFGPF